MRLLGNTIMNVADAIVRLWVEEYGRWDDDGRKVDDDGRKGSDNWWFWPQAKEEHPALVPRTN